MSDPILLSVHGERGPVKDDSLVFTFEIRRDSYEPFSYVFTAEEKLLQKRVKSLVWRLAGHVIEVCDEKSLDLMHPGDDGVVERVGSVGTQVMLIFSDASERFQALNEVLNEAVRRLWVATVGCVSVSVFGVTPQVAAFCHGNLHATLEESGEYALTGAWGQQYLKNIAGDHPSQPLSRSCNCPMVGCQQLHFSGTFRLL